MVVHIHMPERLPFLFGVTHFCLPKQINALVVGDSAGANMDSCPFCNFRKFSHPLLWRGSECCSGIFHSQAGILVSCQLVERKQFVRDLGI